MSKKMPVLLLLLTVFLFLAVGCEAFDSADTEEPVANVKNSTGVMGTWRRQTETEDSIDIVVLALNDNDTFEIYTKTEPKEGINFSSALTLNGTYQIDGDKLTLEYEGPGYREGSDENAKVNTIESTYKLDDDKLEVTLPSEDKTFVFERK